MSLKIGQVAYISGLPISYAFTHGLLGDSSVESVVGFPSELDARMASGGLSAGPVSSLEYIRHRDRYALISDLSIGSWGRIGSAVLLSRVPFGKMDGQTVAMPPQGATSNALTRWLFEKLFGVEPVYIETEGPPQELISRYAGVLLIGDQAILETRYASELHRLDMGEAWWQMMHTPYVQTVWVCQRDLPSAQREHLTGLFTRAKELGKLHHDEIVVEASERLGFSAAEIEAYYALLNYDLTPAHMQSLGLLADYLQEVSLQH